MLKKIVLGLLLGGVLSITASGLVPDIFDIGQDLSNIEELTSSLESKTNDYIKQAVALQEMSDIRRDDITLLIGKIDELKHIKNILEDKIIDLEKGDTEEVSEWRTQLKKAEREIQIANKAFKDYHDKMYVEIDPDKFEYIKFDDRVSIDHLLVPERPRPKPESKS